MAPIGRSLRRLTARPLPMLVLALLLLVQGVAAAAHCLARAQPPGLLLTLCGSDAHMVLRPEAPPPAHEAGSEPGCCLACPPLQGGALPPPAPGLALPGWRLVAVAMPAPSWAVPPGLPPGPPGGARAPPRS